MALLERTIEYLFPQAMLEGTPWHENWRSKEQTDFRSIARIFFPFAALVYVAHYVFFDMAMGLTPLSHWLAFRASMAGIACSAALYYFSPLSISKFYRLPAIAACLVFCYFQARVTVWYPEAPWLYCFLFVGICTLLLRASVLKSAAFALVAIAIQWPSLIEANVDTPVLTSASLVTLCLLLASRSGYSAEIKYFLLSQQNLDSQKRNIELNIEFTDRIKSFIPGEIARRLESQLDSQRTTVLQAIEHVLRPRKKQIACLFSDIRGYTEASKELESFIGDSVLPNVKACTNAIDHHGGIPRKIGDLIFAYFDDDSLERNLMRALSAAVDISRINTTQNMGKENSQVERYILLSSGDAYVGNIGGFDSSVEITALGSPVNYLSRIDELTKAKEFASLLESGDIILSNSALMTLEGLGLTLDARRVDLEQMGLEVRNFPEERILHVLKPSSSIARSLRSHCRREQPTDQPWQGNDGEAA